MKICICTTPIRPVPTTFPPFGSMAIIQALRSVGEEVNFYHIDYHRYDHNQNSEYFSRSWGTPTNNKIFTFSTWFKLSDKDQTTYLKMCAKNKNTDNIIGYSLLITYLEKEGIINGYVEKVLEPFMDSILETTNEIDIFNMLTSFFNISELYYNNGIPIKYIRILEELKIKTTSSKIRFKIMDILKE